MNFQKKFVSFLKDKTPKDVREHNYLIMGDQSMPETLMSFALLLAVIWATPIEKRFSFETYSFLIFSFFLSTIRLLLIQFQPELTRTKKTLWCRMFISGALLSALSWGLFSAFILAHFELSWTSFFITLIVIALAASQVSIFASQFRFFLMFISLLIFPNIFSNFFLVGKLQGHAISVFFFAYFLMLVWIGKNLNEHFWLAKQNQSRLSAMVNALPGALMWMSSEEVILGVNKKMGELIHLSYEELLSRKLSEIVGYPFLLEFSENLFNKGENFCSQIVPIEGRTLFFVAQKYHHGSEAVILGIDITEQKVWENEVSKLRDQAFQSSKLTNIGEMMTGFVDDIQKPMQQIILNLPKINPEESKNLDKSHSQNNLKNTYQDIYENASHLSETLEALSCFTKDSGGGFVPFSIDKLFRYLNALLKDHCGKYKFELKMKENFIENEIHCRPNEILQVLFSLIENALDANKESGKGWIEVAVESIEGQMARLTISDSGIGVEEYMEEIIFEPSYTTKVGQGGTGVGLSVSKEIIENHKGKIFYNTQAEVSQFVVLIPVVSE